MNLNWTATPADAACRALRSLVPTTARLRGEALHGDTPTVGDRLSGFRTSGIGVSALDSPPGILMV